MRSCPGLTLNTGGTAGSFSHYADLGEWTTVESAGGRAMDYAERAKHFRHQADECRQLADRAHSDSARQTYLNVAKSYDLMADDLQSLAARRLTSDRRAG
jgi:hypothetical protein